MPGSLASHPSSTSYLRPRLGCLFYSQSLSVLIFKIGLILLMMITYKGESRIRGEDWNIQGSWISYSCNHCLLVLSLAVVVRV